MKTKHFPAHRINPGSLARSDESLTAEAPLQIRVNLRPFTTTMRTPGDDSQLARGLLFTEGVIPDPAAPVSWRQERDPDTGVVMTMDARAPEAFVETRRLDRRSMAATASCGICGTMDARDVLIAGPPLVRRSEERLNPALIAPMLAAMRARQTAFDESGGCHAAAAFTLDGGLLAACEDVGRHNAVDKVIGTLIEAGRLSLADATQPAPSGESSQPPVSPLVLIVSGRVSYEIVSKAYRANLPFVLGVSAPSSMAVEESARLGLTLLAFCRGDRATIYSHEDFVDGG